MNNCLYSYDYIKHIHKLVYDELKTRYKINKFINEYNIFRDLNQKININICLYIVISYEIIYIKKYIVFNL
jgi:hypothetical protein